MNPHITVMQTENELAETALAPERLATPEGSRRAAERVHWQSVLEHDPGNETAWLKLAALSGSGEEAISHLRRALEINPQNERALNGLQHVLLSEGVKSAKTGNKTRARWLLMEASALNPQSEDAWFWLAAVSEKAPDAIRCLQKVLKLNPQHTKAIALLDQVYALKNSVVPVAKTWQCPICAAAFQVELSTCPNCRVILQLDVAAILANQEVERAVLLNALKHYQNLTESLNEFDPYYYLGLTLLHLRRLPAAARALQKASQLRPGDDVLRAQLILLEQRKLDARTRTVLVLDASAALRQQVSLTLGKHGHRVLEAAEVIEALSRLKETTPDLILVNNLPGMAGYQICKIIKAYPTAKHVPIVLLGGKGAFFDKMRARLAGAQGCLTIPFAPQDLLNAVGTYGKADKQGELV